MKYIRLVLNVVCYVAYTHKTLLGTPYLYWVGPFFAFLSFCGIDSTNCCKHSLEILLYVDMKASPVAADLSDAHP